MSLHTYIHTANPARASLCRVKISTKLYVWQQTAIHNCRRAPIASQRRHARRQHCGGAGGAPGRPSWPGRAPPQLVPKLSLSGTVNDGDRLVVVVAFLQKTFVCLYIHTYIHTYMHLGSALSFAVVTEWPVRVYPRHRCRSPPHACMPV